MIEIPVYNRDGQQVGTLPLDEKLLGGQVRPALLKQAFVRQHANQRQGTAATKSRSRVEGSTRKLYKQKHTGNARRGAIRTNIMRGGGRGHGKVPHSWRKEMPDKMRRLANRNCLLAKATDGELKLIDRFDFAKPSTSQFSKILGALKIDRSCIAAFADTRSHEARSAANIDRVCVARIDHLNVYDMLNHRYLLTDKAALEAYLSRAAAPQHEKEVAAVPEEAN